MTIDERIRDILSEIQLLEAKPKLTQNERLWRNEQAMEVCLIMLRELIDEGGGPK